MCVCVCVCVCARANSLYLVNMFSTSPILISIKLKFSLCFLRMHVTVTNRKMGHHSESYTRALQSNCSKLGNKAISGSIASKLLLCWVCSHDGRQLDFGCNEDY